MAAITFSDVGSEYCPAVWPQFEPHCPDPAVGIEKFAIPLGFVLHFGIPVNTLVSRTWFLRGTPSMPAVASPPRSRFSKLPQGSSLPRLADEPFHELARQVWMDRPLRIVC